MTNVIHRVLHNTAARLRANDFLSALNSH